jgi:hypothetical protein
MLGGAVGIAVVNSVWFNYVRSHLASTLAAAEIDALLVNINSLSQYSPIVQIIVRTVCSDGYNLQMRATLGFAAGHLLVLLLIWRKRPYRLSKEGALE